MRISITHGWCLRCGALGLVGLTRRCGLGCVLPAMGPPANEVSTIAAATQSAPTDHGSRRSRAQVRPAELRSEPGLRMHIGMSRAKR